MQKSLLDRYLTLIYDKLDSTMEEAERLIKSTILYDDLIILANEQLQGQGTQNKQWISSKGNLHLSLVLPIKNSSDVILTHLPFLTANVLFHTIEHLYQKLAIADKLTLHKPNIKLKWPNDVLINDHKIAGVLTRIYKREDTLFIVIGIGMNIIHTPSSLGSIATSLHEIGLKTSSVNDVLLPLIQNFSTQFDHWKQTYDFTPIKADWLKNAYRLGQSITITVDDQKIFGIFEDVAEDGSIKLLLPEGAVKHFYNGYIEINDMNNYNITF